SDHPSPRARARPVWQALPACGRQSRSPLAFPGRAWKREDSRNKSRESRHEKNSPNIVNFHRLSQRLPCSEDLGLTRLSKKSAHEKRAIENKGLFSGN